MQAAILRRTAEPLSVERLEMPRLKDGQVLVKLAFSGVCRSQLMEVRGLRGHDAYLPHLLGHEGSGEVLEVGKKVTKVRAGDQVILGWIKGHGCDEGGTCYHDGHKQAVNAGAVHTFNEYAVVSENRVTLLPSGIPLDVAVLFGCALPTGAGIVLNQLKPSEGSTVAIFGLGGIGLSALMATKLFGCSQVIAIDNQVHKLALAREFGATHTIDSSQENAGNILRELTKGVGVDYSVEATGLVHMIETAFSAVRKGGGRCVFASHPEHGAKIQLDPHELISGKHIEGSWGGGVLPDRDIPRLADLYVKEKMPFERLIAKDYQLKDVNQALSDLESGKSLRPVLSFG